MNEKSESIDVKIVNKWDDGSSHDDVAQIYVRGDLKNIQSIQVNYVGNDGQQKGGDHCGYGNKGSITATGGSRPTNTNIFTCIHPTRLEAKGWKKGKQWDDGEDHEGVTKIYVRGDREGVQNIKINYVKNEQEQEGSFHGLLGRGFTQSFEIDHLNNEHLIAVEGYYDDVCCVIQALQFKTNIKTSELMGYDKGKKFSLAANGREIIGFHGYSEKNLNSLGVYLTPVSATKSEWYGGAGNASWDDGVFDSIRKVTIFYGTFLSSINFDYNKGNTVAKRVHGHPVSIQQEKQFELDHPNEFITSVEGTYKNYGPYITRIISLTFKTSKGRTFATHGTESYDCEFVLEKKGCAVVGFHGRVDKNFFATAIGAYYYPLPPTNSVEKLESKGSNGGSSWDDGVFDRIRKIYVGQYENSVAYLKFVYNKDTHVVMGDDHGNKAILKVEEFDLEDPYEYITAVEGCYNKGIGSEVEVITMLRFKTNKRTSRSFGFKSTSTFVLEKECYKIVGFYGKASSMIYQLGVHVVPIYD